MNIKAVLFSLLIVSGINAVEYTEKQDQLYALTNEIVNQDKKVSAILARIKTYVDVLEHDMKEFDKTLSDEDCKEIYVRELERFVVQFEDQNKSKEALLFDGSLVGKETALLKFFFITYINEKKKLENLLRQWAILNDELSMVVVTEIEGTKNI